MAKDDYFVVMYQILKMLYEALKNGHQVTDEEFSNQLLGLNEQYWNYIIRSMNDEGFITGVFQIRAAIGTDNAGVKFHNVQITPQGIEYLFSNGMMERVKNTLKDIKGIVPGF